MGRMSDIYGFGFAERAGESAEHRESEPEREGESENSRGQPLLCRTQNARLAPQVVWLPVAVSVSVVAIVVDGAILRHS